MERNREIVRVLWVGRDDVEPSITVDAGEQDVCLGLHLPRFVAAPRRLLRRSTG
jgi:hypothetical protein